MFRFSYLHYMSLYSKFPKLAFNQRVVGSSPTRLINKTIGSIIYEQP